MFELFIARRYLRAKRKQVVISVITVISVIGVAAGVMALVIALAINNGFRRHARSGICWAPPRHVSILEKEPARGIRDWERLPEARAAAACDSARRRRSMNGWLSERTGEQRGRRRSRESGGRRASPLPDALQH